MNYVVRGRYAKTVEAEISVVAESEQAAHLLAKAVFAKQGKVLETKIVETEDEAA